jgi:hypothetical protein
MTKILLKSHPPYFLKLVFNANLEALFGLNRSMEKIYSVVVRKPLESKLFHEVKEIPEYYGKTKIIRAIFEVMKED